MSYMASGKHLFTLISSLQIFHRFYFSIFFKNINLDGRILDNPPITNYFTNGEPTLSINSISEASLTTSHCFELVPVWAEKLWYNREYPATMQIIPK